MSFAVSSLLIPIQLCGGKKTGLSLFLPLHNVFSFLHVGFACMDTLNNFRRQAAGDKETLRRNRKKRRWGDLLFEWR